MTQRPEPSLPLSTRINRLFAVVHPRDAAERDNATVARQLTEAVGRPVDTAYVASLRDGGFDGAAPESDLLAALAGVFGVRADYLLGPAAVAAAIDRELELLATMRDAHVAGIALRGEGVDRAALARIITEP
ncbi:hypothetical protein ACWEVD_24540 [Nocardia thailandica]|uniref:Transcriptional regulator n=1 Tax=Nocardia thailandica TaxID=257275 RepID=A0ABW6PL57_9NOCA|nr:hypothetical protein [Nocardia thailandica]